MTELTDDGRTWWVCGANTWPGVHLYEARNGRAALAAYRRDLTAAERADGRGIRHTQQLLTASGLYVVAGPLTTPQAHELDLAMALAEEATRWTSDHYEVPIENPMSAPGVQDMFRRITPEKAARIRAHVLAAYLPREAS